MKRLFWLLLGAAAGVAATRKYDRVAATATPGSIAATAVETIGMAASSSKGFLSDVRTGMDIRDAAIRDALQPGDAQQPAPELGENHEDR